MQNQPSDHVNWYSDEAIDQPAHLLKDDTDYHIKTNPVYKKMVEKFITDRDHDKELEIMRL